MDSGAKSLIIFVGGAVVGGLSTWFFTKKYYQRKAEEEIISVEKAFEDRLTEVEGEKDDALDAASKSMVKENPDTTLSDSSRDLLKQSDLVAGMIEASKAPRVNYKEYFNSGVNSDSSGPDIDEGPQDDPPEIEPGDDFVDSGSGLIRIGTGSKTRSDDPYIISFEDYGEIPGYSMIELCYYTRDGVIAEGETGDIVDNPGTLIGNLIEESGFADSRTGALYIRNEVISTDYEITKIRGSYA